MLELADYEMVCKKDLLLIPHENFRPASFQLETGLQASVKYMEYSRTLAALHYWC